MYLAGVRMHQGYYRRLPSCPNSPLDTLTLFSSCSLTKEATSLRQQKLEQQVGPWCGLPPCPTRFWARVAWGREQSPCLLRRLWDRSYWSSFHVPGHSGTEGSRAGGSQSVLPQRILEMKDLQQTAVTLCAPGDSGIDPTGHPSLPQGDSGNEGLGAESSQSVLPRGFWD